jgi:hypothetical protein
MADRSIYGSMWWYVSEVNICFNGLANQKFSAMVHFSEET